MKHDEFVKEVQERGHMGSREEAESAIRATLQTLAERLKGEEAEHLASQLPPGVAEHLRHERAGVGESLDLQEFFDRVDERDEVADEPSAIYHARVVVEVLQEATTKGEMDDIRSQLPAEYAPLFEAGSQGEMDT
jgi:uncharacterized protein (DUF2267 family)